MDTQDKSNKRQCKIKGCYSKKVGRGFCHKHYKRFQKYGNPLVGGRDYLNLSLDRPWDIKTHLFRKRRILPNGCWEWTGQLSLGGYGRQLVKKKQYAVHRLIAFLYLDFDIFSELKVCHKCDNRKCFNPDHLFIGTQQDNIDDMFRKGRANKQKGSKAGASRLHEDDVLRIKELLATKMSQREIAEKFSISQATISLINLEKSWCHLWND